MATGILSNPFQDGPPASKRSKHSAELPFDSGNELQSLKPQNNPGRKLKLPDVTGEKSRRQMENQARRQWQQFIVEHGVDPITHKLMMADPKLQRERAAETAEAMERVNQRRQKESAQASDAKLMADRARQGRLNSKIQTLSGQFGNEGVHLRKTRRPEDEHNYVLNQRNPNHPKRGTQQEIDSNYWHATSTVMKDLPLQQYSSFSSSGLVISNKAELGGWGKGDLGLPTKNVKRGTYPDSFPQTAAPQANGRTLGTMPEVTQKLIEMRKRVHGEIADQSTTGKQRDVERMIHMDGESFPSGQIKTPYRGATSLPYNEAQIHYTKDDVLAVHTELLPYSHDTNPNPHQASIDALRHVDMLRFDHGVDVPIVQYHLGNMQVHSSREEFVEHLRSRHPETYKRVKKAGLHKPKRD